MDAISLSLYVPALLNTLAQGSLFNPLSSSVYYLPLQSTVPFLCIWWLSVYTERLAKFLDFTKCRNESKGRFGPWIIICYHQVPMILAYRHQYFGEILFFLCSILGMKNFNLSPGYHQKDDVGTEKDSLLQRPRCQSSKAKIVNGHHLQKELCVKRLSATEEWLCIHKRI